MSSSSKKKHQDAGPPRLTAARLGAVLAVHGPGSADAAHEVLGALVSGAANGSLGGAAEWQSPRLVHATYDTLKAHLHDPMVQTQGFAVLRHVAMTAGTWGWEKDVFPWIFTSLLLHPAQKPVVLRGLSLAVSLPIETLPHDPALEILPSVATVWLEDSDVLEILCTVLNRMFIHELFRSGLLQMMASAAYRFPNNFNINHRAVSAVRRLAETSPADVLVVEESLWLILRDLDPGATPQELEEGRALVCRLFGDAVASPGELDSRRREAHAVAAAVAAVAAAAAGAAVDDVVDMDVTEPTREEGEEEEAEEDAMVVEYRPHLDNIWM